VIDCACTAHRFGSGEDGPAVTIRLTDKAVEREICLNPGLRAAEASMDGRLVREGGQRGSDLLLLCSVCRSGRAAHPVQPALRKVWRTLRRWQQHSPLSLAAENIRDGDDIPPESDRLWLDETMTYSCACNPTLMSRCMRHRWRSRATSPPSCGSSRA
jgi:cyclopropane-fatty-acyl-phospholipid synthase